MLHTIRHAPWAIVCTLCISMLSASQTWAQTDSAQVQAVAPSDSRLGDLIDLDSYFPFEVPDSQSAWEQRATALRRQVLVATGLWPMPQRTPLEPVIHGKSQRDGFTVEKVYFQSVPNHFVTGLLFRPDDGKQGIKRPAVLCPHGHGGRMQDYGVDNMQALIESGAENYAESGRFPKLARCAHLARMGCVVFIFDMLGYADSQQISEQLAHRLKLARPEFEGTESWGLFSAQAEMRLQSIMGIQTWNCVRCLDFLEQLPDVDGSRIGVTGGSGGGTQTILLCAIDSRPVVAFPNGMVSTAMQGGCTCENCALLRVGTGNVELAALFAPKPQAMTAANDWTKEMMTKGYPQLQQLYAMLGAPDNVYCRPLLHFPHNYNYVSRATMYEWFNRHLGLNLSDIEEKDFKLLTPEETKVWNDDHPQPAGGEAYERALTKYMGEQSDQQLAALTPTDSTSLEKYREVIGGALNTILGRDLPRASEITRTKIDKQQRSGYLFFKDRLRLDRYGEELTFVSLYPTEIPWNGEVVALVDDQPRIRLFDEAAELTRAARQVLESGAALVRADLLMAKVGEQRVVENPREAAAYTFCYNPTLFAHRVHDLLTLISFVRSDEHAATSVHLVGMNGGGPLAAAAGMLAGDAVDRMVIDTKGFRFAELSSYRNPNFVPGIVKYGDLPALLALNAPRPLLILGEQGQVPAVTQAAYRAADAPESLRSIAEPVPGAIMQWLRSGAVGR